VSRPCPFCAIARRELPADLVLDEPEVVAFLDTRPLLKGHVLVVPRAHHETLLDVPPPLAATLLDAVRRLVVGVTAGLGAEGAFVAVNHVVSQSVPHLHVHVVPRRKGDGLRGFFWPRQQYASPAESAALAAMIRGHAP
jgi:histidine triad (HIT) family protein